MALGERFSRAWRSRKETRRQARDARRRGDEAPHELFYRAHTERTRVLEDARGALADLAVHERRADLMAHQAKDRAETLKKEAGAAVAAGQEARAHDLLDRVVESEQAARQWLARRDELGRQLAESRRTLERLERQAETARSRQMQLLADTQAAEARERLARAVPTLEGGLSELDVRMREAEALAAARAEISWHDPSSEQVVRAFEELSHEGDVCERLRRINAEYGHDARVHEQLRRRGGAGEVEGH